MTKSGQTWFIASLTKIELPEPCNTFKWQVILIKLEFQISVGKVIDILSFQPLICMLPEDIVEGPKMCLTLI